MKSIQNFLEQHRLKELSAVIKMLSICTVHMGATSHIWLTRTWNVASATQQFI